MRNQCFSDYWCVRRSLLPQRSRAQRPAQSTQLWAPAFPPNIGLWFENWIWAVSVLMRMQEAHQGEEPQREQYENISILISKYSGSLNTCAALLLLTFCLAEWHWARWPCGVEKKRNCPSPGHHLPTASGRLCKEQEGAAPRI